MQTPVAAPDNSDIVRGQPRRLRMTIASRVLPGFYLKLEWLWQEELPDPLGVLAEFDAA